MLWNHRHIIRIHTKQHVYGKRDGLLGFGRLWSGMIGQVSALGLTGNSSKDFGGQCLDSLLIKWEGNCRTNRWKPHGRPSREQTLLRYNTITISPFQRSFNCSDVSEVHLSYLLEWQPLPNMCLCVGLAGLIGKRSMLHQSVFLCRICPIVTPVQNRLVSTRSMLHQYDPYWMLEWQPDMCQCSMWVFKRLMLHPWQDPAHFWIWQDSNPE